MEAQRSGTNSTGDQPCTSLKSSSPPSHSTTSSPSSSELSRAQSPCSSATSQSTVSDTPIELSRVQSCIPPTDNSEPNTVLPSSTISSSPRDHGSPSSAPQRPTHSPSRISSRVSKHLIRAPFHAGSAWLSNMIGIVSLAASLSSLIYLGVRAYKLEVSQAVNGVLQACTSLIQANLTTLEASSPNCKESIAKGATNSPYHLGKRTLEHPSLSLTRFKRAKLWACSTNLCQEISLFKMYYPVVVASIILVFGGLLLAFARRRSRSTGPVHSAARSDVQVTRHTEKGTETDNGKGIRIMKHIPDQATYPGQLRQRIRSSQMQRNNTAEDAAAWQPINSSTVTLVNQLTGHTPSKVSITNRSANEKHEGLIELETAGENRTFFDPETDEFIYLTPWKSTHRGDDERYDHPSIKAATKGNTIRALARTATGLAVLAGGKQLNNAVVDTITDAENIRIPQRAGDCLAGEVTNELPSGRPQTV